jgi:hypothetical protein
MRIVATLELIQHHFSQVGHRNLLYRKWDYDPLYLSYIKNVGLKSREASAATAASFKSRCGKLALGTVSTGNCRRTVISQNAVSRSL